MTEQEHQQQVFQAKAHLRILERKVDAGLVSSTVVQQARERLDALQNHRPTDQATTPAIEPVQQEPIPVQQLPLAVRQRIEELTNERNAIHAEKAKLSNRLHTIPDEMNCRDLVQQILKLRQAWRDKQDQIYQIMQLGVLAAQATVVTNLPNDPDKIRFQISRLQSNINKAGKRQLSAKELSTKRRQEVAIAKMRAELDVLKTHLHSL